MKKLGRKHDNRKQLLKNLATSIILYEKIETTKAKAAFVKPTVEKIINLAKVDSLSNKRKLLSFLTDKNAVKKIYEDLIPRYSDQTSGYLETFNIGYRVGDGAPKVIIRLLARKKETKKIENTVKNINEIKEKDTNESNKKLKTLLK